MKILVFTEKNDFYNIIKQLIGEINHSIVLEKVSISELTNLTLSSPEHLVILDDHLFEYLNHDFFDILKKNQNKLLVLLKEKNNIKRYLNLSVLDYYIRPVDWQRFSFKLKEAIKYMERMGQLNHVQLKINKYILKRKTDIIFIDYDHILFFEKKDRIVMIHTLKMTYETHESLKNVMDVLPNYFIRTHNTYVVNFNHVCQVVEEKNRSYVITFKDYNEKAHMSRLRAENMMEDKLNRYRLSFIAHKRKES